MESNLKNVKSANNWVIVKCVPIDSLLEERKLVKGFSGNSRLRKSFLKTEILCSHSENSLYQLGKKVYLKSDFLDSIYKEPVQIENVDVWLVPVEYIVAVVEN